MDKKLLAHEKYIKVQIDDYNSKPKASKDRPEIIGIYNYHLDVVHDFQHERLIHLIVTLFFGFMLIFASTSLFLISQSQDAMNSALIIYPIMMICGMLFVVEIFYIIFYYQLENGCQRLYELTKKLYSICN